MLFIALFILGIFVGAYTSVVGGGYLVLFPVLTLMGVPVPIAIATLRLSSAVQQFVSIAAFWRKQAIDWKPALWFSVWALLPAYYGARLLIHFDEHLLSYVIAVLMLALLLVIPRLDTKNQKKLQLPGHWLLTLAITAIPLGFYAGFYGAAASTFVMLLFMLAGHMKFITASANASVVAFFTSSVAALPFLQGHLINWQLLVPITAGGMIGCWLGVDYAVHFGMKWVRILLYVLVAASVVKLIFMP